MARSLVAKALSYSYAEAQLYRVLSYTGCSAIHGIRVSWTGVTSGTIACERESTVYIYYPELREKESRSIIYSVPR